MHNHHDWKDEWYHGEKHWEEPHHHCEEKPKEHCLPQCTEEKPKCLDRELQLLKADVAELFTKVEQLKEIALYAQSRAELAYSTALEAKRIAAEMQLQVDKISGMEQNISGIIAQADLDRARITALEEKLP